MIAAGGNQDPKRHKEKKRHLPQESQRTEGDVEVKQGREIPTLAFHFFVCLTGNALRCSITASDMTKDVHKQRQLLSCFWGSMEAFEFVKLLPNLFKNVCCCCCLYPKVTFFYSLHLFILFFCHEQLMIQILCRTSHSPSRRPATYAHSSTIPGSPVSWYHLWAWPSVYSEVLHNIKSSRFSTCQSKHYGHLFLSSSKLFH